MLTETQGDGSHWSCEWECRYGRLFHEDFCKDAVIIGGAVAVVVYTVSAVSSALTAPLVIAAVA